MVREQPNAGCVLIIEPVPDRASHRVDVPHGNKQELHFFPQLPFWYVFPHHSANQVFSSPPKLRGSEVKSIPLTQERNAIAIRLPVAR
jgi:hypothetical protein